ncbi:MAG: hypothetical protein ACN4GK_10475 [Acidimicrobiia bacterium]
MSLETSFRQLREANPVPDPALLTDRSTDLGALLIATKQRSAEMQTQELTRIETPQPPSRRPWLIAATAAAIVILIGFLFIVPNLGEQSDVVVDQPTPTTLAPPAPSVDVEAAFPTQVQNDQASRATIEFAGNAQALVEGGAHRVEIQMEIEADFNDPGVSVTLLSVDGVVTSTGITEEGTEFVPTWTWASTGDKVTVLMVPRGVGIPDTRPAVVVTVQETASSEPIEFVLTAAAGTGRPG